MPARALRLSGQSLTSNLHLRTCHREDCDRDSVARNRCHDQIGPAIIIHIHKHRGETVIALRIGDARLLTHVRERAVTIVCETDGRSLPAARGAATLRSSRHEIGTRWRGFLPGLRWGMVASNFT